MAAEGSADGGAGGLWRSREAADAWRRAEAERAAVFGPATGLMLDLAGVGPGSRVLDVAAGTGEQTLSAACRVGPRGHVLATDISASMLEAAAEAAREAGLANVGTRVMDAQALALEPESFDAAICRAGLMLLPEPHKALVGIREALRPGGKLAAVVFSAPERNPYEAIPPAIVRRIGNLPSPAPGQPGMFALGAPGVLEDALRRAGFRDVAVHAVGTVRRFPSTAEAVRFQRETFQTLRQLTDKLTDEQRAAAWAEIEHEFGRFEGPNGFEAAGEVLIGVGTK